MLSDRDGNLLPLALKEPLIFLGTPNRILTRLPKEMNPKNRHCEERSDVAISYPSNDKGRLDPGSNTTTPTVSIVTDHRPRMPIR